MNHSIGIQKRLPFCHGRLSRLVGMLMIAGIADTAVGKSVTSSQAVPADLEVITQHEFIDPDSGDLAPYLLYEPAADTSSEQRSLLIYLYGARGSLKNYNIARDPYAQLRAALAARGYYILVPDLGRLHFMNDHAKKTLDGIVDQVLKQQQISSDRVHIMGTSMGGGSSLAYAIHRPDLVRSVCAVLPMTDFSTWIVENPKYAPGLEAAYDGTPETNSEAYDINSAVKNLDAFARTPVMLIHGKLDKTVFYDHSQKLADLLQTKGYECVLYTVDDLGHQDEVMREYQIQAADFFDAVTE